MKEKIDYVFEYLEIKNDSYADEIKEDIIFHFENYDEDEFTFLDNLETKEEISNKLEFITSKIILNEHHDGISNIIDEYL